MLAQAKSNPVICLRLSNCKNIEYSSKDNNHKCVYSINTFLQLIEYMDRKIRLSLYKITVFHGSIQTGFCDCFLCFDIHIFAWQPVELYNLESVINKQLFLLNESMRKSIRFHCYWVILDNFFVIQLSFFFSMQNPLNLKKLLIFGHFLAAYECRAEISYSHTTRMRRH